MNKINLLEIFLYEEKIGILTLLPGERSVFAFDPAYIDNNSRSTLSLSFKSKTGDLLSEVQSSRIKLPPFFSNLLPEGPLRDYLAKHAGVHSTREFFLLNALGHDLPGAVSVKAVHDSGYPPPSHQKKKEALKELHFSLAGVQIKFSALLELKNRFTLPVDGVGGSWIIKLASSRFKQVPENEFSMMTLAQKMGMEVPEIKLVPVSQISGLPQDIEKVKGDVFAIRRFDRSPQGPIHIEDFAQVFRVYPEEKYKKASYKNIAEVLWHETGQAGITEFIRRLVFSVLIGNADMHLKNWSLIYPNRLQAHLAPAYDFVSTIVYLEDEKMALKVVKSKRMKEFSKQELSSLALKVGIPEKLVLNTAQEAVEGFHQVWNQEKKHLPLSKIFIARIEKHVKGIKLVEES